MPYVCQIFQLNLQKKKVSSMETEHFKYFSVPLSRVTCVLQNLPEVDVCKSFIPTVLLGTESFTKTVGWMGLETIWLINNVHMIESTVHNSR